MLILCPGIVKAAGKAPPVARLTTRTSEAKAAADALSRTNLSTRKQTRPSADSDSDSDVAVVRSRAAAQQKQTQMPKPAAPLANKQQAVAPHESDSDDSLMHAPRQRTMRALQPSNSLAQKAKAGESVDRRSSKDSRASTAERPHVQAQTAALAPGAGVRSAGRQQSATLSKLQPANAESTDNDSDEEQWKAAAARPPRAGLPQGPQVSTTHFPTWHNHVPLSTSHKQQEGLLLHLKYTCA